MEETMKIRGDKKTYVVPTLSVVAVGYSVMLAGSFTDSTTGVGFCVDDTFGENDSFGAKGRGLWGED